MKVGLAIYNLLVNDDDLNTTAVYPETAPEGVTMPYYVYSVVSNTPSDAKDGTPIDEAQVEVYTVANSYSGVNTFADKVRAALDRKGVSVTDGNNSIVVQSIQYTNEVLEVSNDRKTYVAIQDYTIRVKR